MPSCSFINKVTIEGAEGTELFVDPALQLGGVERRIELVKALGPFGQQPLSNPVHIMTVPWLGCKFKA